MAVSASQKDFYFVKIRSEWCKGCGICISFCPKGLLALEESNTVTSKDHNKCSGCKNCEIYCPDFAITIEKKSD